MQAELRDLARDGLRALLSARRVVSQADVCWADVIFVMVQPERSHVLDIRDDHQYLDPELVEELRARAGPILAQLLDDD